MATFTQWNRSRKLTRVSWVCGTEEILQRAVAAEYRSALSSVHPLLIYGSVGQDAWNVLTTLPPGRPEVVFVRHAQDLGRLWLLQALLGDEFDGTYTVFFSDEPDFQRISVPGSETKTELASHLAALRDSRHGQLIRCCLPGKEEELAGIVASWWPDSGRNLAAELLDACGRDLTQAWYAVEKAQRAGFPPSHSIIPSLCVPSAHQDFAGCVIAGQRKEAMDAAREVSGDEVLRALGLLTFRLGILARLAGADPQANLREEAVRLSTDVYVVSQLRPHARGYGVSRVARCREILALAESSWKAGARDGILEAVAALW